MFGTIPEFNQSLEMLKNMWGQGVAGQNAGQFPFTADMNKAASGFNGAFAGLDIAEIEKRIKDLKSVENWLNLNLNVLKSTIQGLEVQQATLLALRSFGEAMGSAQEAAMANVSKATTAATAAATNAATSTGDAGTSRRKTAKPRRKPSA
ncbi:MAG: PhaM family polyhydroxyalkanoate granule multifunctional regulatory protein [Burkholderiaceae bacterium]